MNLSEKNIIDITPTISSDLGVFPGDRKFELEKVLSFDKGDSFTLGNISTTLHLGAHTDAPIHYHERGDSVELLDLSVYLGPCQVIEVQTQKGERISVKDIENKKITAKRILFKTHSFLDPNNWNSNFTSLSPEIISYLSDKGVKLIGIDTPSIDPEGDKEMLSHKMVFQKNMRILEGITLEDVKSGTYQLIALPLKIKGADASPVRAILIE